MGTVYQPIFYLETYDIPDNKDKLLEDVVIGPFMTTSYLFLKFFCCFARKTFHPTAFILYVLHLCCVFFFVDGCVFPFSWNRPLLDTSTRSGLNSLLNGI